jgi:hypothetical protein
LAAPRQAGWTKVLGPTNRAATAFGSAPGLSWTESAWRALAGGVEETMGTG